MSDELREELAVKRRQHHIVRLKLAKFGMNAPVELIIEEEDLAKDVRAIERELGYEQTPTIRERHATPAPPRYVAPEPEPSFQERMVGQQQKARQDDIAHQMNLINIHRRNLAHLRTQLRELGAFAPPYVRNGVADAIAAIANRKGILRKMGQAVDDLPGDT